MTEILGSDEPYDGDGGREAVAPEDRFDLSDAAREDDARRRTNGVARAFSEPGTLAVTAALAVPSALLVGPSYRFDAYPFSIGVPSLRTVFNIAGTAVHPLREYLHNVAPTALLLVVGLVAGVMAVGRAHDASPGWVRPLAAGACVVCVVLLALVALGVWHASALDLTTPPNVAGGF